MKVISFEAVNQETGKTKVQLRIKYGLKEVIVKGNILRKKYLTYK